MELRRVSVLGVDLHIIFDDVDVVWIAAIPLASFLQYKRKDTLLDHYARDPLHAKSRMQFPASVRDARDDDALFVKLDTVDSVLGEKRGMPVEKLERLHRLRDRLLVVALVGWRSARASMPLPLERRSSSASVQLPSATRAPRHTGAVAGVVAPASLPGIGDGDSDNDDDDNDNDDAADDDVGGRPRIAWVEHDVATYGSPAGTPFATTSYNSRLSGNLPPRESIGRRDRVPFCPPDAPLVAQHAVLPEVERVGAPSTPVAARSRGTDTAAHDSAVSAPMMSALRAVVQQHRPSMDVAPLPRLAVPLMLSARTTRTTAALRLVARQMGHELRAIGGQGSRQKELLLDVCDQGDVLVSSLDHFGMLHRVTVRYDAQGDERVWVFHCATLLKDAFRALVARLIHNDVPVRALHAGLDADACKRLPTYDSWVMGRYDPKLEGGPRVTSLGEVPVALDSNVCFASVSSIVSMVSLHPCRLCQRTGAVELAAHKVHGVVSVLHLRCAACQYAFTFHPFAGKHLNKLAFVAAECSGLRGHASRFVGSMVGGTIRTRSNGVSWASALERVTATISDDMHSKQLRFAGAQKVWPAFSIDTFYQRSQRYGGNHAHNACVTVICTITGQVVDTIFYNREAIKEQREMGIITVPSIYHAAGAPPLTSAYKPSAIEALMFDLEVQQLVQCVAVTMHSGNALSVDDWHTAVAAAKLAVKFVVVDAMAAAHNVISAHIGNHVQVLTDWWHTRKSFAKMLCKLAGYNKVGTKSQKKSKFPALANVRDALHELFNNAIFKGVLFDVFAEQAIHNAAAHDINVAQLDKTHRKQWDKLMQKAKEILAEVRPDLSTSVNEQVHGHRNHYMVKGVKCTSERFQMLCQMAFMSWNMYPKWKKLLWNKFVNF